MMKATTTKGAAVWMVVLLIALLSQATPPAHAEDSHVKGTMILPPTEEYAVPIGGERAVMASEAAEDTLNACKARIPELASVGQHLMAEQSCVGAEQTRKAIQSAPTF